jgi:hypothetical protein
MQIRRIRREISDCTGSGKLVGSEVWLLIGTRLLLGEIWNHYEVVMMVTLLWKYTIELYKWVNYIAYELHLSSALEENSWALSHAHVSFVGFCLAAWGLAQASPGGVLFSLFPLMSELFLSSLWPNHPPRFQQALFISWSLSDASVILLPEL